MNIFVYQLGVIYSSLPLRRHLHDALLTPPAWADIEAVYLNTRSLCIQAKRFNFFNELRCKYTPLYGNTSKKVTINTK